MQQRSTTACICFLLFLFVSVSTKAQDGSVDAGFGTNGKVWEPSVSQNILPDSRGQQITRTLVQSDGKILQIYIGPNGMGTTIIRYLSNGTLDGSFGSGGRVAVPWPAGLISTRDAYLYPDNKFLVVGRAELATPGAYGFGVLRFNADGTLDNSFDGDGKVVVYMDNNNVDVNGVTVQSDGKILVVGVVGPWLGLLRLSHDGFGDTSFDQDGKVTTSFSSQSGGYAVAQQPDGKIVVGGYTLNTTPTPGGSLTQNDVGVIRYNVNGSLDGSFGVGGKMTMITTGLTDHVVDLAIEPGTGKIILFGEQAVIGDADDSDFFTMKLLTDGTPDPAYGSGGRAKHNVSGRAWAVQLGIQEDGKFVLGGTGLCSGLCPAYGFVNIVLHRVLSNGTPDPSFGSQGRVELSYQPTFLSTPGGEGSMDIGGTFGSQGTKLVVGGLSQYSGTTKLLVTRLNNSSALIGSVAVPPPPPNYITIPARIEAEAYVQMNGIQTETTSDAGGGQNVGYIDNGDWLDYNVSVPTGGNYTLQLRVASQVPGAIVQVYDEGGQLLATVPVPQTGSWQTWATVAATVALGQGQHTIRLYSGNAANWNINWLEFSQGVPPPPPGGYVAIPARIEAEAYTAQSGTQAEGTTDAGGGLNIGFIDNGDWLEYKITAPVTGTYSVFFRIGSQMSGGMFRFYVDGQNRFDFAVPHTGGWQNFATAGTNVMLTAGDHTIRLQSISTANWNINWLEFTQGNPPPPITFVPIPAKIEAESYYQQSGTQDETTADAGGGQNIGYIDNGDWMEYRIHVPSTGSYDLLVRVASHVSGGSFEVRTGSGNLLTTFVVPNTGGWQTWVTLAKQVTLPAGDHIIRFTSTGANWNINWLEFTSSLPPGYVQVPAKIEAEDWGNMSGVQTEATSDAGGGLNVGYIDNGDWLEYNVYAPSAGSYLLKLRVASQMDGGSFQVRSGSMVLATVNVPNTGSWQTWTTLDVPVNLPQGYQTIRLISTGANWNINWLEFAAMPSGVTMANRLPDLQSVENRQASVLSLYPNPVDAFLQVTLDRKQEGRVLLEIMGMDGVVLRSLQLTKPAGHLQHRISLGTLKKGTYLLRLQMEDWTETRKIIKQ